MKCVWRQLRAKRAGFSLLELTFASGILAMTLSLLFGSLLTITMVARLSEDQAVANTHLASALERVRGMSLDELMAYEAPELKRPGVRRAISLVCFDVEGKMVELPLTGDEEMPELPNPLEVKATLLWSNDRGHVFESSATVSVAH